MSITLQDFIFPMSIYFSKKLWGLDKTERFREIVKVLDEVGIRSVRNTGYRTQPGNQTLRSLRSGQRSSSLSRRGKSWELWYRVARESSRSNIQGHSLLPRSYYPTVRG